MDRPGYRGTCISPRLPRRVLGIPAARRTNHSRRTGGSGQGESVGSSDWWGLAGRRRSPNRCGSRKHQGRPGPRDASVESPLVRPEFPYYRRAMRARQAVIVEPFKVEVRDADLADPAPNQILVECEASAISAGTELAV